MTDEQYTRMIEVTYEPLTLLSDITDAVAYFFGGDNVELDAQAKEFSKTALIQIAGRAGRGKDSYDDQVHFYYQAYNQQIRLACDEIRYLNQQAKK